MEDFIKTYHVSRETLSRLETFVKLLTEWQQRLNLVSNRSLADVWQRHIADSAQLFEYIDKENAIVYDFGSGAGFPGMVLAVLAAESKLHLKLKLIESTTKKTVFLNVVKEALNLENVEVINNRIENLKFSPADYITSRALAALPEILAYAYPLSSSRTKLILPKGRTYQAELGDAQKKWNFKHRIIPNKISSDGVILMVENLRRKR